jgi:hypothetical protein
MAFKNNYRLGTPYRIDERNDIRIFLISPWVMLATD